MRMRGRAVRLVGICALIVWTAACAAPLQRSARNAGALGEVDAPTRVALTSTRPTVGVAFGGGSARGIAHVGVIRWLEEHRIPIDVAAGTSMGGLIGGAFATGMDAEGTPGPARLAELGRAVRRVDLRLQEHPTQDRRARVSLAAGIRTQGRHRAPHVAEQRRVRRVDARSHLRAVPRTWTASTPCRRRSGPSRWISSRRARSCCGAARWPTPCAPRCRFP